MNKTDRKKRQENDKHLPCKRQHEKAYHEQIQVQSSSCTHIARSPGMEHAKMGHTTHVQL